MKNQLAIAISLAAQVFETKTDKAGQPYILHCLRVMNAVAGDDELMQVAVLHDVIEDTNTTLADLRRLGFSDRVIETVSRLTHTSDTDYDQYIKWISFSRDATKVKLADLKDNSDITRLKGLTKKDFDRMEKYHKSYVYLSSI